MRVLCLLAQVAGVLSTVNLIQAPLQGLQGVVGRVKCNFNLFRFTLHSIPGARFQAGKAEQHQRFASRGWWAEAKAQLWSSQTIV